MRLQLLCALCGLAVLCLALNVLEWSEGMGKHVRTVLPKGMRQTVSAWGVPHDKVLKASTGEFELFSPGSLHESRPVVLSQCLEPRGRYNLTQVLPPMRGGIRCFFHEEHKMLGITTPKSGSSSAARIFKEQGFVQCSMKTCWALKSGSLTLHGDDNEDVVSSCYGIRRVGVNKLFRVLVFREPLDRLLSGFAELQLRIVYNSENAAEKVPGKYLPFRDRVMDSVPGSDRRSKALGYTRFMKTKEGRDMLRQTWKEFGDIYNGETDTFNIHLVPQYLFLSSRDGVSQPYDVVININDFATELVSLMKRRTEKTKSDAQSIQLRSSSIRDKREGLSDIQLKRLCRAVAVDYCCLNIPLPEPCTTMEPDQRQIMCRAFTKNGQRRITTILV